MTGKYILTVITVIFAWLVYPASKGKQDSTSGNIAEEKPKISFTFDDGSTSDMPGYRLSEWNEMLLGHLAKHHIKAVFFVCGSRLEGDHGKYVLSSWDKAGHKIANHTWSHLYFTSKRITLDHYQQDFLKNDSLIRAYKNFYPYFRFPYLKEGDNIEKVEGFRQFLRQQGYRNGHVTIDASDWYVDSRLRTRLQEDSTADISGYRRFYIDHLYERALYYDSLATLITGKKIHHTILLHHNLAAALFLDDLIQHFKNQGWEITDAATAYEDPFFRNEPTYIPAGESLVWAMAKESGKHEQTLRYPAEDGAYEKEKMDRLGL